MRSKVYTPVQRRRAAFAGRCGVLLAGIAAAIIPAARVRAHDQGGNLGTGASATDYYEISCFDDGAGAPGSLEIRIRDASPGSLPHVSAQVQRGLSLASVSDTITADIVPSPSIHSNEGAGVYNVLVDKSGPGAKFYQLTYHCWTGPDGTGVHTGSALVTRQSQ
ncbi:MAG: hypothetical protein R3F21_13875 [Myxococcota bacterium]